MATYDLIVIGTGPGGYVCAIRAAQLGLKTAVVEKNATYGGTCLNIGCIPSKALLHASELFEEAGHSFAKMGIGVSAPKLDLKTMLNFKQEAIDGNVKGVDFLFKKNKIEGFKGAGRIAGPGKVEVKGADGKAEMLEAKAIVIATGSDVARRCCDARAAGSYADRRGAAEPGDLARWNHQCDVRYIVGSPGVRSRIDEYGTFRVRKQSVSCPDIRSWGHHHCRH